MSAKTAKGWAIVGPKGSIRLSRMTADAAKAAASVVIDRETYPYRSWKDLSAAGYRCLPCTITVTEEPTK